MFPFNTFSIMFTIVPVLVIGVFIFVFVKMFSQWNHNNKSPMLNVQAVVVDKYTHHSGGEHHHTSFYVVFEVQSGDRMEFHVYPAAALPCTDFFSCLFRLGHSAEI